MTHSKHGKRTLSALVAALVISLALPACDARVPLDSEAPLVTLQMPTDPHRPAVAVMTMGGHIYRMAVDTGASHSVLHLPIAQRWLAPVAADPARRRTATGLHGEVDLQWFNADQFTVGHWASRLHGSISAIDMGHVAMEEGVDGVLGVNQLVELDWHWDNRKHQVLGYSHGTKAVQAIRARLHCEQLKDVDGDPAVVVTIGNEQTTFVIDTGDLNVSGGLHPQDRVALEDRGAVRRSGKMAPQYDIDGSPLANLQATQIQNISLGPTRLDGLILREINFHSRLGRAFISKFDEVLFDFESGQFCFPAVSTIEADEPATWMIGNALVPPKSDSGEDAGQP